MPIQLTKEGVRQIFPKAPEAVIAAFVAKQAVLDIAGITHTRTRLSVAFSQVEHEVAGFTIKNLTENINYSAEGAAKVWPSRFPSGADQVRAKYGTAKGWQRKLLDDVYGNRMGNRPGTADGSTFPGHGGPQWTGREGHEALARILKTLVPGLPDDLSAEDVIAYAIDFNYQPEVLASFWIWKNLNPVVDAGGIRAVTKIWNGGYIGMADREAMMAGNDPVIARLALAERILPMAKDLPGSPPSKAPPKDVIDATTKKERSARKAGVGGAGVGGGNEAAKTDPGQATKAATEQPSNVPLLPTPVAYGLIAVCVVVVVVATILIARKKAAVIANWF